MTLFLRRALLAVLLAILAVLAGPATTVTASDDPPRCSPDSPAPPLPGQITLEKAQIAFVPPAGWTDLKPEEDGRVVFSRVGPNTHGFRAQIDVIVLPVEAGRPARLEAIAQRLRDIVPLLNYKSLGAAKVKIGTLEGLSTSATFNEADHDRPFRERRILVRQGDKIYVFLFATDAGAWARDVGAFEKMMASVRFLGGPKIPAGAARIPPGRKQ